MDREMIVQSPTAKRGSRPVVETPDKAADASSEEPASSPACSPRKRQLMEHIRSAAAAVTCPTLLEVQSLLPANFPQPDATDVRLFYLAIQENCWRLVTRLLAQFPTIVLHHHYDETPLIAAIRCGLEDLAVHLVEHGASVRCTKLLFDSLDDGGSYDWYEVSAREMAYEKRMLRLLEIIDYLTGNYFAYLKPPGIAIRMLRPVRHPPGTVDTSDVTEIPADFFTDGYVKPADPVAKKRRPIRQKKLQQQQQQQPKQQLDKPQDQQTTRPKSGQGKKSVSMKQNV